MVGMRRIGFTGRLSERFFFLDDAGCGEAACDLNRLGYGLRLPKSPVCLRLLGAFDLLLRATPMIMSQRPSRKQEFLSAGFSPAGPQGPNPVQISAAMRLLEAGVDTTVIALWLGHEQIDTTAIYLHADLSIKERALARTTQPGVTPGRYRPPDQLLAFLQAL